MSENDQLKQKIAALAGRINRHKAQQASSTATTTSQPYTTRESLSVTLPDSSHPVYLAAYEHGGQHWTPTRGTPYGSPRGRSGYGYRSATHKNRTLIVNSQSTGDKRPAPAPAGDDATATTAAAPSTGWVTKRDRHMQLINTKVYDQKVQERTQAMAETRKQKEQEREQRQKAKLDKHLRSINIQQTNQQTTEAAPAPHIVIDGIKFIVADGGSKLIRSNGTNLMADPLQTELTRLDEANIGKATPKTTSVGGVAFVRSKHGNLYRSGLVKTMRSGSQDKTCGQAVVLTEKHSTRVGAPKSTQLCPTFCSTGKGAFPSSPSLDVSVSTTVAH